MKNMGRERKNKKKSRNKWIWRLVWDFLLKILFLIKKMMWRYIYDVDSDTLNQRCLKYFILIILSV